MSNAISHNQASKKVNKNVANSTWQIWQQHHHYAIHNALNQLRNTPLATLHTIIVIALALSLPAALQVFTKNANLITEEWGSSAQISLYLKPSLSKNAITLFIQQLDDNPTIIKTQFLSKADALEEFKTHSGFENAIDILDENPLPAVIIVTPNMQASDSDQLKTLFEQLSQYTEVNSAELDLAWVQRLFAMINLIKQICLIITSFLVLTVVFVIGNTIRLLSQNYYQEIKISKLVGATDSFVRKPFLYAGLLFGFFGSLLACILVGSAVIWIRIPLNDLTTLYHTHFFLEGLNISDIFTLICVGMLLGFGGAYMAVNRFLHDINKDV